jgi:hypothetical protein
MSSGGEVNDLLSQHKAALNTYREWDEKVKMLLKGRRAQDLMPEDMEAYRQAAAERDAAYDIMRHLERALLEDIPGASTQNLPRINLSDLANKKKPE